MTSPDFKEEYLELHVSREEWTKLSLVIPEEQFGVGVDGKKQMKIPVAWPHEDLTWYVLVRVREERKVTAVERRILETQFELLKGVTHLLYALDRDSIAKEVGDECIKLGLELRVNDDDG